MGIQIPANFPAGTVVDFAGTAAPDGWLFSYGQAISRTTYAALFAAIGTAFGVGDGSTTFNLPDLRGRATFGKDDMGGAAANRVTSGGAGVAGGTLGAAGGGETVTLSTGQIPSHNHGFATRTGGPVAISATNWFQSAAAIGGVNGTDQVVNNTAINASGGGGAHANLPPAVIVNKIIKY